MVSRPADWGLSQDPDRRVRFTLSSVLKQLTIDADSAILEALSSDQPSARDRAAALSKEALEVAEWLFSPMEPLSPLQLAKLALESLKNGFPPAFLDEYLPSLQGQPPGRPHRRRDLIIRAFELQLKPTGMSLGTVTNKLCPCGKAVHSSNCRENIRAGIRELKKLLRRYASQLVMEYQTLHPDRNKKSQ